MHCSRALNLQPQIVEKQPSLDPAPSTGRRRVFHSVVATGCDPADGSCSNPNETDDTVCDASGSPGTCQTGVCVAD